MRSPPCSTNIYHSSAETATETFKKIAAEAHRFSRYLECGYSWHGLPAELYPHGAETLDFTGFPRYLLLRCEDEIAGCFAGDLLSQVSYTPKYIFTPVCIHAERFFLWRGCPGQFVVTLQMMISNIPAPPISARQGQVNAPLFSTFSASDSSSQSSRFPHLRR